MCVNVRKCAIALQHVYLNVCECALVCEMRAMSVQGITTTIHRNTIPHACLFHSFSLSVLGKLGEKCIWCVTRKLGTTKDIAHPVIRDQSVGVRTHQIGPFPLGDGLPMRLRED